MHEYVYVYCNISLPLLTWQQINKDVNAFMNEFINMITYTLLSVYQSDMDFIIIQLKPPTFCNKKYPGVNIY